MVSTEMSVLAIIFVGYGNNKNKSRVWEKVGLMVCHSNCKHIHQRLLPAIHQFSELER